MFDSFDYIEPCELLAQQAMLSVLNSSDDSRIDDICGKSEAERGFPFNIFSNKGF